MKRHVIAIDLDGTTLTRNKIILPRTKQAIGQIRKQGHEVIIATGRPPRSSVNYYRELGLDRPMVNFNGALIHDPQHPERDVHFPMDRDVVMEIIDECRRYGVHNVMVEMKDKFYAEKVDELIGYLGDGSAPDGVGPIESYVIDHPTSILIHTVQENIIPLRQSLNRKYEGLVAHRYWSAPYHVIEVVKAGVSKATGLQILADRIGFAQQDVIAFGDEDNDLEMIEWAGLGVAMGNANPKLKDIADVITDTNECNGIALQLEKLFLK